MANWFIRRHNDFDEGPLTASELKARVASGKLKPSDRIRREDNHNYVTASSVKGLFNEVSLSTSTRTSPVGPLANTLGSGENGKSDMNKEPAPNTNTANPTTPPTILEVIIGWVLILGLCVIIYRNGVIGFVIGLYSDYYWPKTPVSQSNPFEVRNAPTGQMPTNPNEEAKNQLVQLNQRIEDWKARKDRLQMLVNNLDRDKAELVKKLKALGASPTDQKSNDPKGAVLLAELRDVLKQSLIFEKKHKEYDLAIFKSESRVRTIDRRIAAKEVAGTDEELAELIRSMIELDESLDSESKEEIPIELDDLVKESLAVSSDSWKKNSVPEEQPKPVKQDGIPLFGGNLLDNWESESFSPPSNWTLVDEILTCNRDGPSLVTKRKFKDFDLHIEFSLPRTAASGVFLRGRYEIQLLDPSYRLADGQTVSNIGSHGSIWGLIAPSEISYVGPNKWNSLDVRLRDRNVTVTLNDKTVIRDQRVDRPTAGAIDRDESTPGPIMLQTSTVPGVQFRNAWIKTDPFTWSIWLRGSANRQSK